MSRRVVISVMVCVSCKSDAEKNAQPVSPPAPPAATIVDAHQDAPAMVTYTSEARGAVLFNEVLDECIGFSITTEAAPEHSDAAKKWVDERLAKFNVSADDKKLVRIGKPCEEQFKDRVELASCRGTTSIEKDVPVGVTAKFTFAAHTYRYEALADTDVRMQECLEMGGDWKEIDRNSSEFREARLRHNAANLERTGEALQRMMK